jgi:Family of unknown function (DUF6529)
MLPVGDLVETLTRGNVTEVKVILASVVLALAVYQLILIAVAYGRIRPPFLASRAASFAHRASGDAIAVLLVVVAVMCLSYFGLEDDAGVHVVAAATLLAVLALKILVIRRWHRLGRLLPLLGTCVFVLLLVTWATSAGDLLADR